MLQLLDFIKNNLLLHGCQTLGSFYLFLPYSFSAPPSMADQGGGEEKKQFSELTGESEVTESELEIVTMSIEFLVVKEL